MPAEAWGALGLTNLGESISGLVDEAMNAVAESGGDPEQLLAAFQAQTGLDLQEDLLSWMGDAGVFVQGTTPQDIGGAIVITTTDPDRSSRALGRLVDALRAQNIPVGPPTIAGADGFSISDPGLGNGLNVVATGDRVVIGLGDRATEAALDPQSTLTDASAFGRATDALGADVAMAGYFDVSAIIRFVVNASDVGSDPIYNEGVKPWLEPISFFTFGSQVDSERLVQRVVVGVE